MFRKATILTPKVFSQYRWFSSSIETNIAKLNDWLHLSPQPMDYAQFETLQVSESNGILSVALHRPEKLNAMNMTMWMELESCFNMIENDPTIRVVILSGSGKAFTTGMDLSVFAAMKAIAETERCEATKRRVVMDLIQKFQNVISAPEKCRVPTIAKIHSFCIGGGVDFISACDLRYCSEQAEFSVKEIDLAIVADIGTLQRLPKLVGLQKAKEWSYTGKHFYGTEAAQHGLVLECLPDTAMLNATVDQVAKDIAGKSAVTIQGVKKALNYQQDHTIADSLDQVKQWNAAMLYSKDLEEAFNATLEKRQPNF